jgi:hypothetical protein
VFEASHKNNGFMHNLKIIPQFHTQDKKVAHPTRNANKLPDGLKQKGRCKRTW